MTIDPYHLAALAGGIVVGASIVYAAGLPKHTDRVDRVDPVDILAECRREDGTYPPPPSGGSGQATARDTEAPPQEQHPLALPSPDTTERLRLWSHEFDLIVELPADAKQPDEGLIRLTTWPSTIASHVLTALKKHRVAWLAIDSGRGRWFGVFEKWSFGPHDPDYFTLEFRPEPEYLSTGWVWEPATPRAAWGTGHPSYPQA